MENLGVWGGYLVSESMQGSSQAIHGCTEGKIRVRQGTSYQVTGMGTDITTFMVTESGEKCTHVVSNIIKLPILSIN